MNRNLFGKSPRYSELKSHELEMQGKKKDMQRSRRMSRQAAYTALKNMPNWNAAKRRWVHAFVKNNGMAPAMRYKLKQLGIR